MPRLLNNQPRRISIYTLQRRPSFGFESSVSSTPMISGDPVVLTTGNKSPAIAGMADRIAATAEYFPTPIPGGS